MMVPFAFAKIFSERFWVLFRERGILSFFHAGKITTHREKILHFRCGYFRPCVCVPLFGPGGPVFKVRMVISVWTWMMQQVVGKFCVFVAAIAGLCVCATWRDRSCVKILHFRCGYFWLVCVCVCVCMCVCMYVLRRATWQLCENSVLSLWLFPAYVYVCLFALLCVWTGPGRLWGAHQLWVFLNLKLNVFPVASCHILQL